MTGTAVAVELAAHSAGPVARDILALASRLRIEAVFERSFYAGDDRGSLVCFLRDDMEPGPLNILCSPWAAPMADVAAVGDVLALASGGDYVSSTLVVKTGAMEAWEAPRPAAPIPEKLRDGARRLDGIMRDQAPRDSLAAWFMGLADPREPWRKAFFKEAGEGFRALEHWLAAPDATEADAGVISLLGLGPGLTPSGDDVLAGVLLSLRALGRTAKAAALAGAIAKAGPALTNRISLAHLHAAGLGLGAAPFHDCLNAVFADGDGLAGTVARIGRIGHSSGWDTLCGMRCCLSCRC